MVPPSCFTTVKKKSECHMPSWRPIVLKLGSEPTFWLSETKVSHLQWESLYFHLNLRNFELRYLGGTRELKALIPPIDSTHGHYGSWKYELPTPSVSGRTKNQYHCWSFSMESHCNLQRDFPFFGSSRPPNFGRWYSSESCRLTKMLLGNWNSL